jgi:hypothetical protein
MERAIPILPTEDLEIAKTFYIDQLGFRVTFEVSDDGHSGLLGIARGSIEMTLDSPMNGHGRNACVALDVDDVDSYFREGAPRWTSCDRRKMRSRARERSTCSIHPVIRSSLWARSRVQSRGSEPSSQTRLQNFNKLRFVSAAARVVPGDSGSAIRDAAG